MNRTMKSATQQMMPKERDDDTINISEKRS